MIETLKEEFTGIGEVNGFEFIRMAESDLGYVYQVNTGSSTHYEVFRKKISPICIDFGNRIYSVKDFKESYPKAKAFGVWAWTEFKLDSALNKLHNMQPIESK